VKLLRCLSILFLSVVIAPFAHAADNRITCTPSSTYEDGSPLPAGATHTFSLFGGLAGQSKQRLVPTATVCDFLRSNVSIGVHEYYVTQTTNGVESAASVIVSKAVTAPTVTDTDGDGVPDSSDACPTVKGTLANGCNPTPAPPANVTVTTQTAYEFRPSTQVMAAIGLVPEGVTCGPEEMLWKSVMYCRVKLADSLPVVWPTNRSLREVWVAKPAG
jgi:hypothetical protein